MVVLPSRFEAFGNVALEAMATGTPVIISDRVGIRDLIKDGNEGYIVPFGDVVTLADRMMRLLSDSGLRRQMSKQARRTATRFTWGHTAALYEQVFEEMASMSISS